MHNFEFDDLKVRMWVHRNVMQALPIRLAAIHLCASDFNSKLVKMLSTMMLLSMGAENRKRVRIHMGKYWLFLH